MMRPGHADASTTLSALKKEIKACRNELETVTKVMRMFEATPPTERNRLFKRGTVSRLIFDALRANPMAWTHINWRTSSFRKKALIQTIPRGPQPSASAV